MRGEVRPGDETVFTGDLAGIEILSGGLGMGDDVAGGDLRETFDQEIGSQVVELGIEGFPGVVGGNGETGLSQKRAAVKFRGHAD